MKFDAPFDDKELSQILDRANEESGPGGRVGNGGGGPDADSTNAVQSDRKRKRSRSRSRSPG